MSGNSLFRGSGKPGKLGEFHFAKFVSKHPVELIESLIITVYVTVYIIAGDPAGRGPCSASSAADEGQLHGSGYLGTVVESITGGGPAASVSGTGDGLRRDRLRSDFSGGAGRPGPRPTSRGLSAFAVTYRVRCCRRHAATVLGM